MFLIALIVGVVVAVIFGVCIVVASWGYEPDEDSSQGGGDE